MPPLSCKHDESIANAYSWCTECGIALGALEASCISDETSVGSGSDAICKIRMVNKGKGRLHAGLSRTQSDGILLPTGVPEYFPLGVNEKREITISLDSTKIRNGTPVINVVVWGLDGERDPNGTPLKAKQERNIPIPLRWVQRGLIWDPGSPGEARSPLLIPDRLIVRPGRLKPELAIFNPGNIEEELKLEATTCLLTLGTDYIETPQLTIKVPPGDAVRVLVSGPGGFERGEIVATDQWGSKTIEVLEKRALLPDVPEKPYTAGIDFGTSKSAVFNVSHWTEEAQADDVEPAPIPWNDPQYSPPKEKWYIPSAVQYKGDRALFGWDITTNEPAVRNIKTLLRLNPNAVVRHAPYPAKGVVADFIRNLWARTVDVIGQDYQQTMGVQIEEDQILAVLAMPVGETEEAHEQQKRNTLEAVREALGPSVEIVMVREPECAAADFMIHGAQWGFRPLEGHIACIFECNAGTTDVSFVQISYVDGRPRFQVLCQAGYEFGGNRIDQNLTQILLYKDGIVVSPNGKCMIGLVEYTFEDLREEVRAAKKEELVFPQGNGNTEPAIPMSGIFLGPGRQMSLAWTDVNEAVQAMMDGILGIAQFPEGSGGTPLPEIMARNGLSNTDIQWICLTGGSVLIPEIVDRLAGFFSQAQLVPPRNTLTDISRDPERPLTRNVARGAAAILQVKMPDVLGFDVSLTLKQQDGSAETRSAVLKQGDIPGTKRAFRPLPLQPRQDGVLYVSARMPDDPEGEERNIFVHHLPASNWGRYVGAYLQFRATREIELVLGANDPPLTVA